MNNGPFSTIVHFDQLEHAYLRKKRIFDFPTFSMDTHRYKNARLGTGPNQAFAAAISGEGTATTVREAAVRSADLQAAGHRHHWRLHTCRRANPRD